MRFRACLPSSFLAVVDNESKPIISVANCLISPGLTTLPVSPIICAQSPTSVTTQGTPEAIALKESGKDSADPPPGFGEIPWIMSHVNKAASLVSASVHVNAGLGVIRGECFKVSAP